MSALWNKAKSWSPLGAILRWIQDPNRNDLSHLQLCGEREIERHCKRQWVIRFRIPRAANPWTKHT